MGAAKRKITELHKKYRKERNKKTEVVTSAMQALHFWKQTMESAEQVIYSQLQTEDKYVRANISVTEWLAISPLRVIRYLADKLIIRKRQLDIHIRHEEHKFLADKIKVERILGGEDKMSAPQIASKLQLPKDRIAEILNKIVEERSGKVEKAEAQETAEETQ